LNNSLIRRNRSSQEAQTSHAAITRLVFDCTTIGVITRDPVPGSQTLYTNGPFQISDVRTFLKQRWTYWSSSCLLSKKNIAKAKIVKSLHDMFQRSEMFLSDYYLCTLHWYGFTIGFH